MSNWKKAACAAHRISVKKKDMDEKSHAAHYGKARLYVSVTMLLLAFLGFVLMQIGQDYVWHYWRLLAIAYAGISLGLSWYCKHFNLRAAAFTLWHELFHWLGLLFSIYLITYFVDIGLISRYLASLEVLVLVAFATFLAGIYIEKTFIFVGILLGALTGAIGFAQEYLYNILILAAIVGAVTLMWYIRHKSKIG